MIAGDQRGHRRPKPAASPTERRHANSGRHARPTPTSTIRQHLPGGRVARRATMAMAPALIADGGHWIYTLDDNNAAVQALNVGDMLTDTFTVHYDRRHRAADHRHDLRRQRRGGHLRDARRHRDRSGRRQQRHAGRRPPAARRPTPMSTMPPTRSRQFRAGRRRTTTATLRYRCRRATGSIRSTTITAPCRR